MNNAPEATAPKRRDLSKFRNWLSLSGAVLSGSAIFAFLLLFAIDIGSETPNPYMGILAYIVAPGFFVTGLAMLVIGWVWNIRRAAHGDPLALRIDLNSKSDRRRLLLFSLGAFGFMLLTSVGSYQTYHYTESVQFCGAVCHEPMEPQFATYSNSPHAHIACVKCHIGSNPAFLVESKISGVRKLRLALTDGFDRPIKAHNGTARIIESTCKECHWPDHYQQDLIRRYDHYLSDDDNTYFGLSMVVNAKGGDFHATGKGAHWHTDAGTKIEYLSVPDEDYGELIPWVRVTTADGDSYVYRTPDYEGTPDPKELKPMSCITCHNRPSHQFQAPNDSIERALSHGRIDKTLPKIKYVAAQALTAEYDNRDEADKGIALTLKQQYPDAENIDSQIKAIREIYHRNFFPEMQTDWSSHPDNTGHRDRLGCFRCHDDEHSNQTTGRIISAENCNSCHTVIAQGSKEELNDVAWAGMEFKHPDGGYLGLTCADCHTGALQE